MLAQKSVSGKVILHAQIDLIDAFFEGLNNNRLSWANRDRSTERILHAGAVGIGS